jgi:hypothetical protein
VHARHRRIYLCEVTYDRSARSLIQRLESWKKDWAQIKQLLLEDSFLPFDWEVVPWLFLPKDVLDRHASAFKAIGMSPEPRYMHLEDVVPWRHKWNHQIPIEYT